MEMVISENFILPKLILKDHLQKHVVTVKIMHCYVESTFDVVLTC